MMYEECLQCKKLGNSCDGPNFLAMPVPDLVAWGNARRKQLPGMTYDKFVGEADLSKGTVSGFFGGTHSDYRLETIRPILRLLVGGKWGARPCADPTDSERAAYEKEIETLKTSIVWHEDKIKDLQEKNASLETLVKNTNARATTDKDFLRAQIQSKNRTIRGLVISLVGCVAVVVASIIIQLV